MLFQSLTVRNLHSKCSFSTFSTSIWEVWFNVSKRSMRSLVCPSWDPLLTISAFETGDTVSLFAGMDYSSKHALVNYRVKKLAYLCIKAVHQNRLVAETPYEFSENWFFWFFTVNWVFWFQNIKMLYLLVLLVFNAIYINNFP